MEGCSLKSFEIQFNEKHLILELASVQLQLQKKHQIPLPAGPEIFNDKMATFL